MITRAKFQNFKALRDVEITFDSQLTVLVGPNGSGKTSVLEGIQFLGTFAQQNREPHTFTHSTTNGTQEVFGWGGDPPTLIDLMIMRDVFLEVATRTQNEAAVVCRYKGIETERNDFRHEFQVTKDGIGIAR